jgi:hypothetical protein
VKTITSTNEKCYLFVRVTRTITRLYGFDPLHYPFKREVAGDFKLTLVSQSVEQYLKLFSLDNYSIQYNFTKNHIELFHIVLL